MKRYFGVIVAVAAVVIGIIFTFKKWDAKTADAAREQSLLKLRGDFLERAAWVRNVPDQKAYTDENQTFMRWYFKEVTNHLNRHGGDRDFKDYLQELDARAGKGKDDPKADEKKAVYEYTRAVFDELKKGDYAPWWSATDKGIRLDIVSADSKRVGGEDMIHMPVVVWGLPRDEKVNDKNIRQVTVNASFKFNWKLYDEKGKLLGEMPGEGGPDSRVDWPDRYIKFFPPLVVIGHYDIDKLPAEVKKVEIEWNISARSTTGGDIQTTFKWEGEPPAAWKLGAGEGWKGATESERPEEEIDPSKRKK